MTMNRCASILRLSLIAVLLAGTFFQPQFTVYAAANDISGVVKKDSEGDGNITGTFDTGLENVHVYLYRDNGDDEPGIGDTLMAETLTSGGAYSFTGQPNGTYWVVVESDDINGLGTSVEQTYGGVGVLIDADAQASTPGTPRATAGAAFGGRRMTVVDGFTSETKLLEKAEHIIRIVLDGSGSGHTNLDFGFGFQKGLPAGYSEYYVPTQITGTTFNADASFGQMDSGIWDILFDLDNDTAIAGGMHYIISVGATTDSTTVYYDHWEDGYDFDPLNPATADITNILNKGGVQVYESANIPHNPRGTALYYDGRDRIFVAGGLATVTVSLYPQTPGSVYNVAFELLPVKPLQTYYVAPVGEGMTNNGQYDFSQTFLTIQSAADNNTVTVDDPSEPGVPDLTVVLDRGEVIDVRHTAPGTIVQGTSPIQVQMISGYYAATAYSEADGLTIFPRTLWDDEYYAPVESAGDGANDGGATEDYATELYIYNPTSSTLPLYWEDINPVGGAIRSGTYNLAANSSTTYAAMAGHFVPIGSAAYVKSTNGQKFWAIGQSGVTTNDLTTATAVGGNAHTNFDSGYSLVPGYLLRRDYYFAWAPGDSTTLATNASALYVTAVEDGTEVFIDLNADGVPDATDFDNADNDNNPNTGTETSYILNRLESIYIQDPTSTYTLTGAHLWSNGATAAVWAPYPRTASNNTPSLDAGYSALPIPLEWMDAALGILKSVNTGTHKPVVGQQATFTLAIPAYLAVNDVVATDTLPIGWNFFNDASYLVSVIKGGVTSTSTTIPGITGDGTTTRETLTWNLNTIFPGLGLDDLNPNDFIVIRFTAITNASVRTGYNQNDTEVCGTRTLSGELQTFCAEDKLAVYVVPLSIDKDTTTPTANAGGTATYTIRLKNTHTTNIDLTAMTVSDNLPSGFTYASTVSAVLTEGVGGNAGDSSRTATTNPTVGATSLNWGTWTLGQQDELVITFTVNISGTIAAGTYDNTATARATSVATIFTIADIGETADDLGTPLAQDPEPDEDVTIGLSISGKAWLDDGTGGGTSGDGIRNGTEPGRAGQVVYLYDSTGTNILQTDLTDANGDYSFGGLASNTTYIVEFGTPPTGYITTLQDQGGNNTIDSDINPTTRRVSVPLTTTSVANVDGGFVPRAIIGDRIWLDNDGDGAQDVTETGIAGVNVYIDLDNNGIDAGDLMDTTDANGLYLFENLASGTYRVIVDVATLPGMIQTGDPDATLNNEHTLTVTAPGVYLDVDFGYRSLGLDITKTSTYTGALDPGDTIQYTINVTNDTAVQQTGIAVSDVLPLGTTYTAQSTAVNGYVPVVDLFPTVGNGTTGTGWLTPPNSWVEVGGEVDGFNAGNIRVVAAGLQIQNANEGAYRQVDLSNYGSAWLSFTYATNGMTTAGDNVSLAVSTDGTNWTTINTWAAPANGSYSAVFDISSYISANTRIRFLGAAGLDVTDTFIVDNVFIGQRIAEDLFPTVGNGTTGTGWLTPPNSWVEVGEADGFNAAGNIRVVAAGLQIQNANEGAYRQVDLSNYGSAWLSFTYATNGMTTAGDNVSLAVSTDGTNWTTINTWAAPANGSYSAVFDISSYISANTRIRFLGAAGLDVTDTFIVDNLRVIGTPKLTRDNNSSTSAPALSSGDPSTLAVVGDNFILNAGQFMTVTYNVTVDNPLALSNIDNTASVVSTQQTTPRYDSVSDPVNLRGAIGDRVWLDEDSDGVQDAGESGIPNVVVELQDGACISGSTCRTTRTDSEGNYLFANVTPGNYTVAVISGLPAELLANPTYDENGIGTPNVSAVTLTAGQEYVTADFGYNWASTTAVTNPAAGALGAIGDRIWIDADGDGIQDPEEPGLAGRIVTLVKPGVDGLFGTGDDDSTTTAITDANGNYIFDELPAGAYKVQVSAPGGYTQTGDPDSTLDNQTTAPILLAPGDVYVNADFGYQPTANYGSIGDTLWVDNNRDTTYDPDGPDNISGNADDEPALAGVTVALIRDTNGNGVWDAGEPIIATDITNASGQYQFNRLPADGSGTYDYLVWVNDTANVLQGLLPNWDIDTTSPASGLVTGLGISAASDLTTAGFADRDFAYVPVGHAADADTDDALIGDTIFLDRDGGNDYDAGEGLEGVTVELYRDTDGDGVYDTGEPRVASVKTNENGQYFFADLPAGNYVVKVDTSTLPSGVTNTVDPDGGIASQSAVTGLTASQINLAQDFGYRDSTLPNTIGGTIWRDTNTDGTLDADGADNTASTQDDEPGIAGVTVALYNNSGNLVATTTTDSSGNYSFPNLPDGTYRVDVVDAGNVLNGYWHSDGSNPGMNNNSQVDPYTVGVSGGQTNTTADFGYYRNPAAIGNFVWSDDGDGIQEGGEAGLPGVEVTLTITWPNSAGTTAYKTVTDASGYYSFDNLLLDEHHNGAGSGEPTYSISVATPSGYTATLVDQGADDTIDSDGVTITALPVEGITNNTYDSGFTQSAMIGNFTWVDLNGNGQQDGGEPALSGVTVQLYTSGGSLVAATVSDANGLYNFSAAPGNYYLIFTAPVGYTHALQDQGADTIDSDPNPATGQTATFTVTTGATDNTRDAGFIYAAGAIGDRVWLDEDSDGVQDAGESGIPNATVTLTGTDIYGTAVNRTTTTDAEGNYLFTGVQAGTYTVTTSGLPSGLSDNPTYDLDGIGTANTTSVTVLPGQKRVDADFGYNLATTPDVTNPNGSATGAIGDRVWIDANGDGIQDPGEAGLSGVTVNLITAGTDGLFGTADDVTAASTSTGASGYYIFDGLSAGAYVVQVSAPGGYTQTGDPDATLDHKTTTPILLAPGDVYVNADFGYQPSGGSNTIGNQIFVDTNGDGNLDGGEPGIPGVTVALLNNTGTVIATTVTDVNGQYSFPGLPNDTYTVWVNDTANVLGRLVQNSTPNNAADGGQPCGTCNRQNTVTVSGSGNTFQDFGFAPSGHGSGDGLIGDTIFLDRNNNSTPDFGESLEGVTVRLYTDTNGNGIYNAGEPLVAATTTDENGNYYFGNLPAGNYVVRVDTTTLPAGVTNTVDVGDATLNEGGTNLTAGEVELGMDFGYSTSSPNSISGTIWRDTDADGTLDGGEGGRFNTVTVVLRDSNGNIVATTTTDVNGNYSFNNLPDGTYTVDVTDGNNILNGYWHSTGASPNADDNSQSDPYSVTVSGGQDNTTADFGYYRDPSVVGNQVWLDRDNDGVKDADEPGLPGITVALTVTYPNGSSTTINTTTAADGIYNFGNLLLDENHDGVGGGEPVYSISVSAPAGTTASPENAAGANDEIDNDSDGASENATLTKGETDPSYDFGFYTTRLDLGDLPDTYKTLFSPGPAHVIFMDANADNMPETTLGIPAVWLGNIVDTELNGVPGASASGDDAATIDDEDGLVLASSGWTPGNSSIATVTINSNQSGVTVYFGYWIDWDNNGSLETFYNGSGVSGSPTPVNVSVSVPGGYIANTPVYMRVRADDQPFTAADFEGTRINGEVEDYWFQFDAGGTTTPITLSYFKAQSSGKNTNFNWSTATETGNVGFNLYVQSKNGLNKINAELIPSKVVDSLEQQDYSFNANTTGALFYIEDVSILGETRMHGPFRLGKDYGAKLISNKIDQLAINTEHENKTEIQQNELEQQISVPVAALELSANDKNQSKTKITATPKPTKTLKVIKTPTPKPSRTPKPTKTPRVTETVIVPTETPAPPTNTPEATSSPEETPTGELTETPEVTAQPTDTPVETSTPEVTEQPTETPQETSTPEVTVQPTDTPDATPVPLQYAVPVPVDPSALQLSTTLNLKVNKTGLYRVTYEILRDSGLDLLGVPANKLTLINGGKMMPVYAYSSNLDGTFGPGSYIEFYGEALDTLYTDTNIYTVQVSSTSASIIPIMASAPDLQLQSPASYTETLKINNQRKYASYAPGDDPWYDTGMLTYTTPRSWNFTFTVNGLVDAPATLKMSIWGAMTWPQSPDHHILVSLNGTPVKNHTFDGLVEQTLVIDLPAGLLHEGANTIQLTLPGDLGVQYDMIALDWYSVSYQRVFRAQGSGLTFTAMGDVLTVTNLPSANVTVYRMRNSGLARLTDVTVQPDGATFKASFAGTDQADTYLVTVDEGFNTPGIEATRLKTDLKQSAGYLIISHPDFIDGLQPLVQYHKARGLTVNVVDVNDLYTQYTDGIVDPQAIKDYIKYAATNLGTEYVLLVGGDTYDYRNFTGKNSISFIPSLYAATGPTVRYAPVDPLYADLNNDNVPDLPIGRFPVRTSAELQMMVGKTLAYAGNNYGQTAIFAADKVDGGLSFKNINAGIASTLPTGWSVNSINLDDVDITTARQQLLTALNQGTSLVTFTGHSSATAWSFSNLLTTADLPTLTNAGRPFVAVQWGCWNTYYVDPVNNNLVQAMLFSGDRGAAASLGAVSLTQAESERLLGNLLTPRMVTPGKTIGQALQEAKNELAQTNPDLLDVLLGWTLMGDPALTIK